jgi:hypothetical protein
MSTGISLQWSDVKFLKNNQSSLFSQLTSLFSRTLSGAALATVTSLLQRIKLGRNNFVASAASHFPLVKSVLVGL